MLEKDPANALAQSVLKRAKNSALDSALRIDAIAPDPETTIVVNCAGRTRSIIGAQTLIDLAIPNRVVALENGTQGWSLAGLDLDHGASARHPAGGMPGDVAGRRERACARLHDLDR